MRRTRAVNPKKTNPRSLRREPVNHHVLVLLTRLEDHFILPGWHVDRIGELLRLDAKRLVLLVDVAFTRDRPVQE